MAHATTTGKSAPTIADALRAILAEVTPGQRPYSGDSYLPDHLVELAQAAIDRHLNSEATIESTIAAQQHAHNAMATAMWHCARNEPTQALSRLRRATSHIMASMEGRA